MEDPPPSEHTTAVRCDNVCGPASDGIGVDGAWNYQSVCEGERRCGSVGACEFFVHGSYSHLPPTLRDCCSWETPPGG